MADETLSVRPGTVGATGMRYHELALQRWLYGTFFVRTGYAIPVVFSTPMDAFGTFDKLWKSDNNPFKYLFDLKDERGTPLYEPYPPNLRYPLISVFRRGWKYRPNQNYSIHQWRPINWPTVSPDVGRCQLGNTLVSYRPMAWDYRWQIDHYAMRPDTQAYFVEKLMRSMWLTGGTPQAWIPVHYPGWGWHNIRIYIDGDIENSTLEEPEDQKHVEFRTTFTLVMEGYSVDQDIKVVPALWSLLIRNAPEASPQDISSAFVEQEEVDLRLHDNNTSMLARGGIPSDEECQQKLAQYGTYPAHQVHFSGSLQPQSWQSFGFQSTIVGTSPYFMGGVAAASGFGTTSVLLLPTHVSAGSYSEAVSGMSFGVFGSLYDAFPAIFGGSFHEQVNMAVAVANVSGTAFWNFVNNGNMSFSVGGTYFHSIVPYGDTGTGYGTLAFTPYGTYASVSVFVDAGTDMPIMAGPGTIAPRCADMSFSVGGTYLHTVTTVNAGTASMGTTAYMVFGTFVQVTATAGSHYEAFGNQTVSVFGTYQHA